MHRSPPACASVAVRCTRIKMVERKMEERSNRPLQLNSLIEALKPRHVTEQDTKEFVEKKKMKNPSIVRITKTDINKLLKFCLFITNVPENGIFTGYSLLNKSKKTITNVDFSKHVIKGLRHGRCRVIRHIDPIVPCWHEGI